MRSPHGLAPKDGSQPGNPNDSDRSDCNLSTISYLWGIESVLTSIFVNQPDVESHVLEPTMKLLTDQLCLLRPGLILPRNHNGQIFLVQISDSITNHRSTYIMDPRYSVLMRQEDRQLVEVLAEHQWRRRICAGLISLTKQSRLTSYSRSICQCRWSGHGDLEFELAKLITKFQ